MDELPAISGLAERWGRDVLLYATGNATDISMTLMASVAHGMRVGAFINAELASADAAAAVPARLAVLTG